MGERQKLNGLYQHLQIGQKISILSIREKKHPLFSRTLLFFPHHLRSSAIICYNAIVHKVV